MKAKDSVALLLGYGEMGHAMEYLLAPHHEIKIWDPFYKGELPEIDLEEAANTAQYIIFCVPTASIYPLAKQISPVLPDRSLCLSMAKALDDKSRTAPLAFEQSLGENAFGVLYGPMIAEEIMLGRPAFATLAASSEDALHMGMSLFQKTGLGLIPFNDMYGAGWCAVLKNTYAMLFGMADELRLGDNMRGFLAVATLQEMAEIMQVMGGNPRTPYTLAGLGDLITTGTSQGSHHHDLGSIVARGERENLSGEGINTLDIIRQQKPVDIERFPLLYLTWKIMRNGEDARSGLYKVIEHLTPE